VLVNEIVYMLSEEEARTFFFFRVILENDIDWLINRMVEEKAINKQNIWALAINSVFTWENYKVAERIYDISQDTPRFAELFKWLLGPIDLSSQQAIMQKKNYYAQVEFAKKKAQPKLLDPPPETRIKSCLDQFEAGNLDAWWKLNLEITLDTESTHYGNELKWDITAQPGWKNADNPTKERILDAAVPGQED
jgi:predicted NACHT family NTPase